MYIKNLRDIVNGLALGMPTQINVKSAQGKAHSIISMYANVELTLFAFSSSSSSSSSGDRNSCMMVWSAMTLMADTAKTPHYITVT